MAQLKVGDVTIAYELWGEGPPVVLTPVASLPRDSFVYALAGRLSAHHKVLLWDRRNTGASDIKIEDVPMEYQLWADDLHLLLKELEIGPAYFSGRSRGCNFSLYMAHRHPQDVKGLLLIGPPTEDTTLLKPLWDVSYFYHAAVAEREGMQAVIDASTQALVRHVTGLAKPEDRDWARGGLAECIGMNPANRERFLSTDPHFFAATMRQWGEWMLSPGLYRMHLSDEELARITVPALVIPGYDPVHPQETARSLAALLPNAQLADLSEHYTAAEVQAVAESGLGSQRAFLHAPLIEAFLQEHEGVYQS